MNDDRYLPPRLLQGFGMLLLLVFVIFWMLTGHESVLLVGAAGSMILLGRYDQARRGLSQLARKPPPEEEP